MKDICYLDEELSGIRGDHMLGQGHERPLSSLTVNGGLFTWIRVLFRGFPNVFRTVHFPNAVPQPLPAIMKPVKSPNVLLMSFKVEQTKLQNVC